MTKNYSVGDKIWFRPWGQPKYIENYAFFVVSDIGEETSEVARLLKNCIDLLNENFWIATNTSSYQIARDALESLGFWEFPWKALAEDNIGKWYVLACYDEDKNFLGYKGFRM